MFDDPFTQLLGGGAILTIVLGICSTLCIGGIPVIIVGAVFYFLRQSAKKSEAENSAAQSWPSTGGRVIKSRVEVSGGENTSVTPRVEYEYEVFGKKYQNDQIKAGWGWAYSKHGGPYQVIDAYPVGAEVTVYYNPDNPAESALER